MAQSYLLKAVPATGGLIRLPDTISGGLGMSREVQFVIRKGREVRVESPLDTGAPIFHNPSGFAAERAAGVRRQTRMAQFIVSIAMVLAGAYLISMLNPGVLALTLIWTWFAVFPLMARKTWRNLDRGTTIFENGVMTFFVAGTLGSGKK